LTFRNEPPIVRPTPQTIGRQIGCAGTTAGSVGGLKMSVAGPQSHDSPARHPGKGSPRTGNAPGAAAGGVFSSGQISSASSGVATWRRALESRSVPADELPLRADE